MIELRIYWRAKGQYFAMGSTRVGKARVLITFSGRHYALGSSN